MINLNKCQFDLLMELGKLEALWNSLCELSPAMTYDAEKEIKKMAESTYKALKKSGVAIPKPFKDFGKSHWIDWDKKELKND